MMIPLLIALILVFTPAPVPHLEADASRQEAQRGDVVTIDAHEFGANDPITIVAPPGFELVSSDAGPGRALWCYQVADDAALGLATFVVKAGGQTADVWVRVGPIEWPPPQKIVWMPIARA